jgi:hypothetical protein
MKTTLILTLVALTTAVAIVPMASAASPAIVGTSGYTKTSTTCLVETSSPAYVAETRASSSLLESRQSSVAVTSLCGSGGSCSIIECTIGTVIYTCNWVAYTVDHGSCYP